MVVQIQLRRGIAADWTSADTLLSEGEVGLELDTGTFKIGDGITTWTMLPYFSAGVTDHGALTGLADDDHSAYVTDLAYDGNVA